MKILYFLCTTIFCCTFSFPELKAQTDQVTLSGYVKDAESGETLIGAAVFVPSLKTGISTNVYGFYSLTLPKGKYDLVVSYVGYQQINATIDFSENFTKDFEILLEGVTIEGAVVTAKKENESVEKVEMSQVNLKMKQIQQIPALMGEVDVIKAIQLLPGVATVGEGSSGIYVRGGGVDQNLVLLDEAPVYNVSHLLGFFSVFNPDAIKDVQLYKGGIPANYGGRLSSVLDIRMKEGNVKKWGGTAGIGTISSRLTVEGPLSKDNSSIIVSGRRTYADLFLAFSKDSIARQSQLYFYDLNTKVNFKLNEKNRLFLSGYFGKDVLGQRKEFEIGWGNTTGSVRWNHVYNNKLFSNLTFYYSNFDYTLGEPEGTEAFKWDSQLTDFSLKLDYNYFLNPENNLKFGAQSILHRIDPGGARGIGEESIFNVIKIEENKALEHAIYISNEQKIGDRLQALYGLRFSAFQNIGGFNLVNYNENYEAVDSTFYDAGKIFNTYTGLEPRIGLRFTIDDQSSVKLSYNRTFQYIHLASNSTSSSPLDIYFPSSPNVKPQKADQIAAGYFRNFKDNAIETSIEVYYKKIYNSIDFRDHAELLLNEHLEGELRFGEGRAYGLELLLKKQKGDLTGWIGYTLARSERKIKEINDGKYYPTKFDKTHDLSVVLSYVLSKQWNISTNWVYSSGSAVTLPTGRYEYYGMIVPVFSGRNSERLPAYHRLDLSVSWKLKKKLFKVVDREMVFSLYNVYNRKNPYSINFRQEEDDPQKTYAEKTYLFGIIPSVTFNYKF